MTVGTAIVDRLLSLSAVTALVGARVTLMKLHQSGLFPAIRVQRITENQQMHLRGASGLKRSLVQVDTYALEGSGTDAYASAAAVDAAVHGDGAGSGLCGWTGDIGSPAFDVDAILPRGLTESYEVDGARRLVRLMREYEVIHRG